MAVDLTMGIRSDDGILHCEPVELLFDNKIVWNRSALEIEQVSFCFLLIN